MVARQATVLVMAAGTGGHVFPALAIARRLQQLGARIEWLGTQAGMENELLADTGITIHRIRVSGLKGSSARRKLLAPVMLATALLQSLRVMLAVKPNCVLGMGGFVSGPGGIAARLAGKPLIIHEQNAIAGVTNRLLARIATRVFEAFPQTFPGVKRVIHSGNPLREDIIALHARVPEQADAQRPLRILVLGGSQGAAAINEVIPAMLAQWRQEQRPEVWHQTGRRALDATLALYARAQLERSPQCRVVPFITDMGAAYRWADLVICRSGASTVTELAAAGLPAILVPYPYHSDEQQLHNANWLVAGGAAVLLEQSRLNVQALLSCVLALHGDRERLVRMRAAARQLAICDAADVIARACMEYAHA